MAKKSEQALADLDLQILKLLGERAAKTQSSGLSSDPGQQQAEIEAVVNQNSGPLSSDSVRAIFAEFLSGVSALQRETCVSYLGPPHSYSHQAAVERFGRSARLAPVASIRAVFEEVAGGQSQFGLVPIENSTDGRIVDTLGMFARAPSRICGEVHLEIHHQLLGQGPREQVTRVCSKPQAISQCREWLAGHLPQAAIEEVSSTARAAELAVESPETAAIASRQAAAEYGLPILAADIEDNPNNTTRFAVIGELEPAASGNDKTSLMFELPHRPGALAEVMSVFQQHQLNLTWIESFPMPETPNEYLFFVEFEGHRSTEPSSAALNALAQHTVRLEILGSYPRSPVVAP